MTELLARAGRSFVSVCTWMVASPVMFAMLCLHLVGAIGISILVAFGVIMVLSFGFGIRIGNTIWETVLFVAVLIPMTVVSLRAWADRTGLSLRFGSGELDSHGSARFANTAELKALEGGDGLLIGRNPDTYEMLTYEGPAHLITFAPTRAGKGVGTVIPNLLAVERSVLVIDPKGENARITGEARRRFGDVHVLDPFGVADTGTGLPSSAYNPLDRLSPDSLDLGEDAASLTEALVMDAPGQVSEAHWNEEAKALLGGLIMFCVCHEEPDRRTLATVREYLTLPPDRLRAILELMQGSKAANGLIARAANRFVGKADREAASVLSNAQRHTHFLDSPRIAKVLSRSDFHFSDLRHKITSVFLVLPPNRMDAYSRWLRLLVSQALQDIARDAEQRASVAVSTTQAESGTVAETPANYETVAVSGSDAETRPETEANIASATHANSEGPQHPSERLKTPTLFLLDEFAALGRLASVERAMGLMAGYGLQLWPILQDMSQLKDLYGERASTFLANAGVHQVFGVNDYETAKWLSQTMGQATTGYRTYSATPGELPSTSHNLTSRDLLTPDEIMQIHPDLQLLRVQGLPPALAVKLRYYDDPDFVGLFTPDAR